MIDEAKLNAAVEAVAQLQDEFRPQLRALSMRERRSLPKMGDGSIAFVEKAHEYGQTYSELVPPFLDFEQMTRNITLRNQLQQLARVLNPLAANVNDTILLAGSGAYTSALAIYRNAKNAKRLNVHSARVIHDHLAERFARINRRQTANTSAE